MRPSATAQWIDRTVKHEGAVPWPYLDKLGLVTTAIGNLIEQIGPESAHRSTGIPTAEYFTMPWKFPDGSTPSREVLQAAWDAVKARQDLPASGHGGGSQAFADLTIIRLGPPNAKVGQLTEEILHVVHKKLEAFENEIRHQVPGYDNWPADAQIAITEWAWAKGASFADWPKLKAALSQTPPDFHTAAIQSHISNATDDRNDMTHRMWLNAADVQDMNADPDRVYYPGTVPAPHGFPLASIAGKPMAISTKVAIGSGLTIAAYLAYRYWWGPS